MSPKKKPSSKKTASRAQARKTATREVGRGKSPKDAESAAAAPKKKTAAVKPDEMDADVLEFIQAIDDYKRAEGRPFPNWSEVLDIVKGLGYQRRS